MDSKIDENTIKANIEEIALTTKEMLGDQANYGGSEIIKSLKVKKGPRSRGKIRRRVDREDPCVSGFLNEILEEAKVKGSDHLKEFLKDETGDLEEGFRHIGGEITLVYHDGKTSQTSEKRKASVSYAIVEKLGTLCKVRSFLLALNLILL